MNLCSVRFFIAVDDMPGSLYERSQTANNQPFWAQLALSVDYRQIGGSA
jgi:hypothetical protein